MSIVLANVGELSDGYIGGKRLQEAWLNGKKVFPSSYKFSIIVNNFEGIDNMMMAYISVFIQVGVLNTVTGEVEYEIWQDNNGLGSVLNKVMNRIYPSTKEIIDISVGFPRPADKNWLLGGVVTCDNEYTDGGTNFRKVSDVKSCTLTNTTYRILSDSNTGSISKRLIGNSNEIKLYLNIIPNTVTDFFNKFSKMRLPDVVSGFSNGNNPKIRKACNYETRTITDWTPVPYNTSIDKIKVPTPTGNYYYLAISGCEAAIYSDTISISFEKKIGGIYLNVPCVTDYGSCSYPYENYDINSVSNGKDIIFIKIHKLVTTMGGSGIYKIIINYDNLYNFVIGIEFV